jgi:hypothetical protein
MTEKNLARADFYAGLIMVSFGITITVMALQMPDVPKDPYSAPGVLPFFLGVIITGLSLIMFVRSIVRTKGKVGFSTDSIKSFFSDSATLRVIVTTLLCISYSVLLGKLLFPLLTFFFIFVFIVVFEYDRAMPFRPQMKKVLVAALIAAVAAASITAVFQFLFLVRLP